MHIVIASGHATFAGGIETYTHWLAKKLLSRGHKVTCWTLYPSGAERTWVPDGVERELLAAPEDIPRLTRLHKPDVVLLNPFAPEHEEQLTHVARTVLFAHVFYGTCISGSKMHAFPDRRPCTRQFGRACLPLYLPRRCGGLNPLLALRLYSRESHRHNLLTRYSRVLAASHFMLEELVRHGAPRSRTRYVPFPRLSAASVASERSRFTVLFLGRMTDVKGVDLLIDAVGLLKSRGVLLHLELAGDGPLRPSLERRASSALISFRFHGWVTDERKDELLGRAGVLALPSTWPEPYGLVGLEAGARAVPTVAFDVGGVREWLRPGVNGELAPADPPTARGLADALARAVCDPQHWKTLSERAAATEPVSPEVHVTAIEENLRLAAREG